MNIIGIDLGTSNSAAAVLRDGRPVIIPSTEGVSIGGKAFPSYVALTADGRTLVGELARRQATTNPEGLNEHSLVRRHQFRRDHPCPECAGGSLPVRNPAEPRAIY